VTVTGPGHATGYGAHVVGRIAQDLTEHGWLAVSGAAYGIDAATLAAGGLTASKHRPTRRLASAAYTKGKPSSHAGRHPPLLTSCNSARSYYLALTAAKNAANASRFTTR
jgi:hypothetical protein